MKTERRHELQTNTLADHLGKWIVAIRPYATLIVVVVAVIVVAAVAWQVMGSLSTQNRGEAWDEFEAAKGQLQLANNAASAAANAESSVDNAQVNAATRAVKVVISKYEGQPVAYWAHYMLGNHYQSVGTRKLFFDREKAREDLSEAAKHFIEATASDQVDLKQYAYFALGETQECQGEIEKAIEAYDALADGWPEGPLSATARKYSERLSMPETQEFYAFYEKQNPKQARLDEAVGPDGTGLGPDSFKVPGVDGVSAPLDPFDQGPFIPKVTLPKDDSKEEKTTKPDKATDDAKLPEEPTEKKSGEDKPAEKKAEKEEAEKEPVKKAPTEKKPAEKEPTDGAAAPLDAVDGPPKKSDR